MTDRLNDDYETTLGVYSDALVELTADHAARFATPAIKKLEPRARLPKALAYAKGIAKLIESLEPGERTALAVFRRSPGVQWRWDHAVRILQAVGVESPYRVLQVLLGEGLLCMRRRSEGNTLERFELADGLPRIALPFVALSAPLLEVELELPNPFEPLNGVAETKGWQESDGWELPIRLGILWRLAWIAPLKRTQQNILFKRDSERLTQHPLLGSPLADAPGPFPQPGVFAYALAVEEGWLWGDGETLSPTAALAKLWPEDLNDLLLQCGRGLLSIELWNELADKPALGTFAEEVASARFLLLAWLSMLPADEGAKIEQLTARLETSHPPFNSSSENVGAFRQSETRAKLARDWTTTCLLGPMYQCGLVAVNMSVKETPLVRLTSLGRKLLGLPGELTPRPIFPRTLLAQPNHQIIVYRQGLNCPLLARLFAFAEPKTLGAALTFELNADSVYHGLETGLTREEMIQILAENGGRELPSGLAESIRTWSEKRDRLSVFGDVSLFEFASKQDMDEAVARGLVGTPVTDRMLIATGEEKVFANLRITASRDYRFQAEKCVEPIADGTLLAVDLSKSDLMLETELRRFAESLEQTDAQNRRLFRVTVDSISNSLEHGLRLSDLEKWFEVRTGHAPPASVQFLCRAAIGVAIHARRLLVVSTDSALVTDGLLQYAGTAELAGQRLGPTSLAVPAENIDALREALSQLKVDLMIDS